MAIGEWGLGEGPGNAGQPYSGNNEEVSGGDDPTFINDFAQWLMTNHILEASYFDDQSMALSSSQKTRTPTTRYSRTSVRAASASSGSGPGSGSAPARRPPAPTDIHHGSASGTDDHDHGPAEADHHDHAAGACPERTAAGQPDGDHAADERRLGDRR